MEWFRDGGPFMYAVLLAVMLVGTAGVAAVGASVAGWVFPPLRTFARVVSAVMLVGCAIPVGIGAIGWRVGLGHLNAALPLVDPEQRELLLARGSAEAQLPLLFGGVGSGLVVLPVAVALAVAFLVPRKGE